MLKVTPSLFLLAFALLIPAQATAANGQETQQVDRWTYLMKLIEEEEKTIKMARRASDHLRYRLFELQNERIKLYKEKENQEFLDQRQQGKKISRKQAFKNTLHHYERARQMGLGILKAFPNTRYRSAIYYAMGLNSRDYAYDNRELKYLNLAIKYSRKGGHTWLQAMTSLAEYYYNNKKYAKAVALYEQVIHNDADQWHTKNLYNYGWCLLKTQKFDAAITRLEEGYKLSFDTKYIDMREQIMNSLVAFYVLGKQIDRGIDFVLKNDRKPHQALARFAQKSSEKGFFKETETLIELAEKKIDPESRDEQLADLRLFQFDFYNQYKREEKLFVAAKALTGIVLTDYQRSEAIRKISEKAGSEQLILKKDFDKRAQSYDVARLETVEKYFQFLATLDDANEGMYRFYTAETFYSVREFKQALAEYKRALETQLKKPSKMDLNRKIVDGIFSSIDFARLSKNEEMQELEYAYKHFIALWPSDEKAPSVHQNLYAIYFARKDHLNMAASLDAYAEAFPQDREVHQKLFRQRVDLAIKLEDSFRLADLVKSMQSGYLGFATDEVRKSEVILANLLFAKYQKLNQQGETKKAIAGYQEVFHNNHYPLSVKAEAGFNVGILYTDLYEAAKSVKWFKRTFPLFSDKEREAKRRFIEQISKRSALLQDFLNAAHMQKIVLDNFCETKKKNNDNFREAIAYDLANGYALKAEHTYKTYLSCVEDSRSAEAVMIAHLFHNGRERALLSFIKEIGVRERHHEVLSDYLERLFWRHYEDEAKRRLYRHEITLLKNQALDAMLAGARSYESYKSQYQAFFRHPINMNDFNPEKFNRELNERAQKLAELIADTAKLLEIQNAQLSLLAYDQMYLNLRNFAREIAALRPVGMPEEFLQQFIPQMKALANTFKEQALARAKAGAQLAEKYEILSSVRSVSQLGGEALDLVDIRMPASIMANTFDLEKN